MKARYYFNVDYRGSPVIDDIGEEFSSLQEAKAHAALVANELGRNNRQPVTVLVLNEAGTLLATEYVDCV